MVQSTPGPTASDEDEDIVLPGSETKEQSNLAVAYMVFGTVIVLIVLLVLRSSRKNKAPATQTSAVKMSEPVAIAPTVQPIESLNAPIIKDSERAESAVRSIFALPRK